MRGRGRLSEAYGARHRGGDQHRADLDAHLAVNCHGTILIIAVL
jgi:hypothetical protein